MLYILNNLYITITDNFKKKTIIIQWNSRKNEFYYF